MKIYCDAPHVRYYDCRPKDTEIDRNDIFHFCRQCRLVYLCHHSLKRVVGLKPTYLCPVCEGTLVSMPLYRAPELGLTTKLVKRITTAGSEFKNVWENAEKTRSLRDLIEKWTELEGEATGEGPNKLEDITKAINALKFPGSFLVELLAKTGIDVKQLTVNSTVEDVIQYLGREHQYVIPILYNTIVNKHYTDYFAKILALEINYQQFNANYITPNIASELEGTIDLFSINKDNGKLSWFIISIDPIQEQQLNSILTSVLSLNHMHFRELEAIYICSHQILWSITQIVARRKEISTKYGKVALKLCKIEENGKIALI